MSLQRILWDTQLFAPTYYPVELVTGESFWFFDMDAEDRVGFYAQAGGGWRNGGVDTMGGSPPVPTPIPVGVKLAWLSFIENKFYHTFMLLPQDTIANLAKATLTSPFSDMLIKNHINIQFAIAPGGFVSLRAGSLILHELLQKQAEVANMSWGFFARTNHFDPDTMPREQYIKNALAKVPSSIKDDSQTNHLPVDRWKNYCNQKFKWHLVVDKDIEGYQAFFVNGEKTFIIKPELNLNIIPTEKQPVPACYCFFFKDNGQRYQLYVYLSKHEIGKNEYPEDDLALFEAFKGFLGNNDVSSALVINFKAGAVEAFLTNGYQQKSLPTHSEKRELLPNEHTWFK